MSSARRIDPAPFNTLPLMTEATATALSGNAPDTWALPTYGSDAEISLLQKMARELGELDDATRRIRTHIASFTGCDSGVPATIDELLDAIGRGELREPALRNGCLNCGFFAEIKGIQPGQQETMRLVHEVITARLSGDAQDYLLKEYPFATGFIKRTYEWLPPSDQLSHLQKLLVERMLLPWDFYLKGSHTVPGLGGPDIFDLRDSVAQQCYEEGGRGAQIDAEIATLAGLPKITMALPETALKANIQEPSKRDLYILGCGLAHGLHTLSDCHHSSFRWIENWIYAIGTGKWGIPSRRLGSESERLSQLMVGYLLALDKWMLGVPQQFLLLDLGHTDIGFDPKNEIIRVYAYLGPDRTPLKIWLAAYLWTNLAYNNGTFNNGALYWPRPSNVALDQVSGNGISIREWFDLKLSQSAG